MSIKDPLSLDKRWSLLQGQLDDEGMNRLLFDDDYLKGIKSDPNNRKIWNELQKFISKIHKKYPNKNFIWTGNMDEEKLSMQGISIFWSMRK